MLSCCDLSRPRMMRIECVVLTVLNTRLTQGLTPPPNKVSREPTRLQCGRAAWKSGETKQKPHISTNRRWSLFIFF